MFDDNDELDVRGLAAEGEDGQADGDDYEDDYDDDEDAYVDEDGADEDDLDDVAAVAVADRRAGSPKDNLSNLVHYLATNLVDDPDGVVVEAEQRGQTVGITLRVPEEELGKVIGRQGRIARAIRTVLTIAGSRQNVRASLDIEG